MTGDANTDRKTTPDEPGTAVDTGRHLYCLVDVDADADVTLDATGVDGEIVRVVTEDGLGAVVHPRASGYDAEDDAEDPDRVKEWVLAHQSVVDLAGERYGTPLPFRFGVVLEGGDDTVRTWLTDHHDAVASALDRLAGRWEYRVNLLWDGETDLEALLKAEDVTLQELARERDAASEGRSFLVGKQYDRRLAERKRARGKRYAERLREAVSSVAVDVETVDTDVGVLTDPEGETIIGVSVLADATDEDDLGSVLDDFAAEPELAVRFTGPWPPYSFAPSFEGRSS